MSPDEYRTHVQNRTRRAHAIAQAGDMESALDSGLLAKRVDVTLSEALVLGLLRQGVRRYVGVFGHGVTEVAEVLRVYEAAGLVKTYNVRNEVAASHAATALRWVTGEKAAVCASIGPGMMQALAGSLAPASDGTGVWYLFGEETTEDEGPNMQQIPKEEQGLFLRLCQTMGKAYGLHTPWAIGTALRRGLNAVDHPVRPGPFYLLLPMNTQCSLLRHFNMDELPVGGPIRLGPAPGGYEEAVAALRRARRVVVKVGGGAREAGPELSEFLSLMDAAAVTSPRVSGILPYAHPQNMTVGGSKGSLSGNYAMEEADCLVALGTRAVCQSDSSRTGYPKVTQVIALNGDIEACTHYAKTLALVGDIRETLVRLNEALRSQGGFRGVGSEWLKACEGKKEEWERFKSERYNTPCLFDETWQAEVCTQPVAIKVATEWARERDVPCFFDAGDVQANGFQIVEDDRLGRTFTETGASYMGFASSALMATAMASKPFYGLALTGDGSFTMTPQILIDGVEHGARGCLLVMDNRRMGAITGLQKAQYGADYATGDRVAVDYVAWASSVRGVAGFHGGSSPEDLLKALNQARDHPGLSLIHVPVYFGDDPLGGMGVFGRWNVGNWCDEVQALRHDIGL